MVWLFLLLFAGIATYYFYPEKKLPKGKTIDKIEVFKSKKKMLVYSEGKLLKTYSISLGKNARGHKAFEGDFKTPEGTYLIDAKNPNSCYHKNLGISYPNEKDIAHAKSNGKSAGGAIKIHGIKNGNGFIAKFQRWHNWTAGCIAVTNLEIEELYDAVELNSEITIFP